MATYRELVDAARASIEEVEPAACLDSDALILDVRELEEYRLGAVPGARHIPRGTLERDIAAEVVDRATPLILYCAAGNRSALAAASLRAMGYEKTVSMRGGFEAYKLQGHPWDVPLTLPAEQMNRYSRHLLLPGVGVEGQRKLLDSKVVVIGAGGLGSPASLYLAAAGIGTLGIVDYDVVEASNLQRQILHGTSRIGIPKVQSAAATLADINPDTEVVGYKERLSADNVTDVLSGYDVIVDGTDNFPTRYLINDASLRLGIPVVHGSIFRFEGQVSVFRPYAGPCYRCLSAQPPPPELAPSCAEAGVLGVLPGIIGSLQGLEAIKLLLDIGEPLVGRLLTYDALATEFRTLRFRRDPECAACRDESTPPPLVEYDDSCLPPGRA
jgi:molybdopterin/thiamine biosynthesis adenylyltransferase/rhodanese-related sulfurtransferase